MGEFGGVRVFVFIFGRRKWKKVLSDVIFRRFYGGG